MSNLTGIKFLELNGTKYEIQGDIFTEEDIRAAAEEIDPSIVNATISLQGDTVTFVRRAGTKGAAIVKVVYNNMEFEPQTPNPDPKDVKDAMVEEFPELANADYSIDNNGVMTFRVSAGRKGL